MTPDQTASDRPTPPAEEEPAGRDVIVPMRVYKAVTVFSTLFAVAAVLGGFVLLDVATDRAQAAIAEVQPLVALTGLGLIVLGAAAYAFSTRFRAEKLGPDATDSEGS